MPGGVDVASRVDQVVLGVVEKPGSRVDRVALADASEVNTQANRQASRAAPGVELETGQVRLGLRPFGGAHRDVFEGGVVTGGLEVRKDERIEDAAGCGGEALALLEQVQHFGGDRQLGSFAAVEVAQLTAGQEATETLLKAMEEGLNRPEEMSPAPVADPEGNVRVEATEAAHRFQAKADERGGWVGRSHHTSYPRQRTKSHAAARGNSSKGYRGERAAPV